MGRIEIASESKGFEIEGIGVIVGTVDFEESKQMEREGL